MILIHLDPSGLSAKLFSQIDFISQRTFPVTKNPWFFEATFERPFNQGPGWVKIMKKMVSKIS